MVQAIVSVLIYSVLLHCLRSHAQIIPLDWKTCLLVCGGEESFSTLVSFPARRCPQLLLLLLLPFSGPISPCFGVYLHLSPACHLLFFSFCFEFSSSSLSVSASTANKSIREKRRMMGLSVRLVFRVRREKKRKRGRKERPHATTPFSHGLKKRHGFFHTARRLLRREDEDVRNRTDETPVWKVSRSYRGQEEDRCDHSALILRPRCTS